MGTTLKLVKYYCPGCRKTVERNVSRASKFRMSYCETRGKEYRMRRIKS